MFVQRRSERNLRLAKVGILEAVTPYEERAKNKNILAKTFTSTSGKSSEWLIMQLDTFFETWVAASRNFYFGQKCFQKASSLASLESKIQSYVNKNDPSDLPMYRDKYGEYWVLCLDDGLIDDYPHALTAAYDGVMFVSETHYSGSEADLKLWKKNLEGWFINDTNKVTGPIDPPKGLGIYSMGNSTVTEGPPVYTPIKTPPSSSPTAPSGSPAAPGGTSSTTSPSAAKDASAWQLPSSSSPPSDGIVDYAPAAKKTEIPWTPILLGGGALLAITYLVKQGQ